MDKGKGVTRQRDTTDRSKYRVLLCDVNAESCHEIHTQLSNCSYQVAAVWSPYEIFDTLNSQGPNADIILASVDVLMDNEGHIMRYIMCTKNLKKVPVIILTTQDQVSVTVKGLKLGAVDYLVKPLHLDQLAFLWMHSQKIRCRK